MPRGRSRIPTRSLNLSPGTSVDNWTVELYAENVGDTRAQIYKNQADFDPRITTNRPRTIGIHFSQRF